MDETNKVEDSVETPSDETGEFGGMIQDITDRLSVLPHGNSMYQELTLVAGEHPTPARIARQMLAQANTRIVNLRNYFYEKRKQDIKLEAMRLTLEKIKNGNSYDYRDSTGVPELDAELINIEIEQMLVERSNEKGFIQDQLAGLAFLYENIRNMPKFSRSDFESQEEEYFAKKLTKMISANPNDPGAKLSLEMVINRPAQNALLLSGTKYEESKDFANKLDLETLERTLLPMIKTNHLLKDGRNDD